MSPLQALAFGLIQGLTEFLPVSSSGHLAIMKRLLGLDHVPILFDILLHLATMLAVLIVFRARVWKLIRSIIHLLTRQMNDEDRMHLRLIALLIVATAITAVLGVGIDNVFPFADNIKLVSVFFIVTAVILVAGTYGGIGVKGYRDIGVKEALFLGFAQGLGVFPGISRSGITISVGVMAGLKREEAGEFSFLLAIPAILGASLLKVQDLGEVGASIGSATLFLGMASSFISGLLALLLLMRLVKQGRLFFFAFYLIPLGLVGLIWG